MTLLFFSDIPWDHLYQRPQHLASRLAERWPVLWIEPATLGTRRRWSPQKRTDNITILSLPQFPHNAKDRRIRAFSRSVSKVPLFRACLTWIQSLLLHRACRCIGVDVTTSPAVVENFQYAPLLAKVRPAGVVFDYIDDAFGFIDFPGYVLRDWQLMIRLSDRISATSGILQQQIMRETSTPVTLIENGVHAAAYATPTTRPADLPDHGTPTVIYVGTISHWFDLDLLEAMVQAFPGVNVVLLGPVHPDCAERLNPIRKFTNLHVLGVRTHAQIPAYLASATVGIIPFLRNRLTEAVNPVKLYEYAAAGIPVVSTAFSDDLEKLHHIAFIAHTRDEFIADVRTALVRGPGVPDAGRLQDFARTNDWGARASAIAALVDGALKTHRTHE